MTFTVAIIGRPNVGKSTLFNRLVGKRLALVDDTPGVTRDRREGSGRIADLNFLVIDTAGLEDASSDSLEARMRDQTERALDTANVALMLIDARAGVTPMDEHFARWLRQHDTPTVLVANKCERGTSHVGVMESYRLGLGDPIPFSAEHGEGLSDLFEALLPFEAVSADTIVDLSDETAAVEFGNEDDPTAAIQLAIIGRPNVGKSTLVNRLLGENRMLTGPEAGITRDSISIAWEYKGRPFRLVDTAGLRRRSRVTQKLEYLSTADTQRAIRYAQVVVLVIDATQGLERQDLTIARQATDEGRALVLAVNKWDLVEDRATTMGAIRDRLQTSLPQVRGVSVVTFSALTGRSISSLLPSVMKTYEIWNTRIPTGELNRWLAALTQHHPPPMAKGRRIRLRYMTQAKARPPTFVIFINQPEELAVSYLRYLTNGLRDDFGLDGVPIRILTRRGKNPYVDP